MRVAIAVITNANRQILITRRSPQTTHSGFWEFPGGKLEPNETIEEALIREVKEEVALEIKKFDYLGQVSYHCEAVDINLEIFYVVQFIGTAQCLEGQMDLKWVDAQDLSQYQFPPANEKIIDIVNKKLMLA
ncbi:MAG: 8-oxo-dGTP diphosphatase MutT [Legionella sp.]